MNNKFLNKVCDQIVSETRIIDNNLDAPFSIPVLFSSFLLPLSPLFSFTSHCKEVYSLNEQEIEYVWTKYKKEITTLMGKKELV